MGADQSTRSSNEQRKTRNFTEADVRRALDLQKSQLEKEMNDLLRSQVAKAQATASTSISPSSSNSQRVTSSKVAQGVNVRERALHSQPPTNLLERERTPYSHTPNNLAQQGVTERERGPYSHTPMTQNVNQIERSSYSPAHNANQAFAPPLYPTLPTNGNQAPGTNYNPQNPVINVNETGQYGPTSTIPSAPPMSSATARQGRPISRNPGPRQKAESDDVACPTCQFRYTEKIYNCATGHASCSECMLSHQPCGTCGQRITDMRNITMEDYVTQKQISCPNAKEGCCYTFAAEKLERHLQDCPFKEVQCMMPGDICRWKGKLSKLADHFDQFHSASRGEIDTEKFLQLNNTNKTIQLVKLNNYNFLLHQYTVNNKVFIAGQLIGTKGSASKWCYELHIYKKAEPRRKYMFVNKCFSMSESFEDIVKESACAVLPIEYAKTFDNGSGAVVYKYYLKKDVGRNDKEERKRDVSCSRGRGRGRGRGMRRRVDPAPDKC